MKPIKAILGASVLAAALGMGCTWASGSKNGCRKERDGTMWKSGDYHTESTICKYVFEESATAYEVKGVLDDGKKVERCLLYILPTLQVCVLELHTAINLFLFYSYFCVFLKLAPSKSYINNPAL